LRRYHDYQEGRETLGHFMTFCLVSGVVILICVALATTAIVYLG
jgi:hypothetical protein